MVTHRFTHLLGYLWILLCSITTTSVYADNTLEVRVDRDKIYENESLELTFSGRTKLELSFGTLFNFAQNPSIPEPDVSLLEADFEILNRQQKYNINTVNDQTEARVDWIYTLIPKRSGTLTIPALAFEDQRSNPITVTVLPGRGLSGGQAPLVFLEATVDKPEAHVQEQLIYTIRLFHRDRLLSGELSKPEPADALVEPLGEQQKTTEMRLNQRYDVLERRYLIFPQKSGELRIDPLEFVGNVMDSRAYKRRHTREKSNAVTVNIKAPPGTYAHPVWLPAISLNLSEKWDKPLDNIHVGDSLTRTISVQTLGLLGSAIPPISPNQINGLKLYPDQPDVASTQHPAGVQSSRTEVVAIVATKAGDITIPEIQLPWFDTINQTERVAILPARIITVEPATSTPNTAATAQLEAPANVLEQAPLSPDTKNIASEPESQNNESIPRSVSVWPFYVVIVLMGFGWAATTWYLLKRTQVKPLENRPTYPADHNLAATLRLFDNKDQQALRSMIGWLNQRKPRYRLRSVDDLREHAELETLFKLARHYEELFFARNQETPSDELVANIKAALGKLNQEPELKGVASALPEFYPAIKN